MTELYKRNGAVFVPVGITLEEVEKLIEKRLEHSMCALAGGHYSLRYTID